jgi:YbbR domain-containing protein
MNWVQRLPGAIVFFARGAFTSVFGNLSLALLSIALAVTLWVYVTDRENPSEVQTFNGSIPVKFVNIPNGLDVANASETTVQLRVEAPKSEIGKLRPDDFDASVNMGGFPSGQVTVSVDATSSNGRVQVLDVTPPRIDVTLEDRRDKEVPVKVSLIGSPQQGFTATNQTSAPTSVTVSGPESLVALVDSVAAEVILTGERSDISEDRVELKPRDVRGGEISRVTVNPTTARVNVSIEQRDFTRTFVVSPTITGVPAPGYNVTGVNVDPPIVSVTGTLDVLQSIDAVRGIATDEISIADARADVVRTANLVLPAGARQQGATGSAPAPVQITVSVTAAKGEQSYLVVPQVRNVTGGLVVATPDPVTVTLAGDVPTLQAVTPESIVVIVDAQGLDTGLHSLPIQITPPAGTTIVASDPAELGIALIQRQ